MENFNIKPNKLLKRIILFLVDKFIPKNTKSIGRPSKYTSEQYLDAIFYVLKEGIGWEYLTGFVMKGNTAHKIFYKWRSYNIFNLSWHICCDMYGKIKPSCGMDFSDVYIDASHIKNM